MIIIKNFQTTIDLFNSSEIYNVNKNDMVIQKLNERYKNTCYQSCFILEINRIIRQSCIRMIDNRIDGSASIDVMFEAKCLIFNIGEIICGAKIFKINHNMITAIHDNAAIIIKNNNNKINKVLQVGDIIPVIITGVKYNIGNNKISTSAYPLSPELLLNETIYFNITESINNQEKEKLNMIISNINEVKEEIKSSNNQIINLFKILLYPYKSKIDINKKYNKKIEKIDLLNIDSLLKLSSGCILYTTELDKSEEKILYLKDENNEQKENSSNTATINSNTIHNKCYNILSYILNDYLYYILGLKELVLYYGSIEKIKTINNYWKIYNENKL